MKAPDPMRPRVKHEGRILRRLRYVKYFVMQRREPQNHPPASRRAPLFLWLLPDSNPNTPTPLVVPTYTFPFAIIGVMYLFPLPK